MEELREKSPPNISEASCLQGGTSFRARRGTTYPFTPGKHSYQPEEWSFLRDFHKDNPIVKEVNTLKDCN